MLGLCRRGWAVRFGATAEMRVPYTSGFIAENNHTVELWFRVNAPPSGTYCWIFNRWTSGQWDHGLTFYKAPERLSSHLYLGPGSYVYQTIPATSGAWHHFATSYDGQTRRGFLDGQPVANVTGTAAPVGTSDFFFGLNTVRKAAEVILDGCDLTLSEIRVSTANRYTSAFAPADTFSADGTTQAVWHLDEGTGASAADASGNGHTGTLAGPYQWVADDR